MAPKASRSRQPHRQPAADARNNPPKSKVHGGQDITDGNEFCTANLSMTTARGGHYVMTAGHCFPKGDGVSQNGSNSNVRAYTASKSIGQAQSTPVHKDATTSCDCEAVGTINKSRTSNGALVNHDHVFRFAFVAFSNKYFTGSPHACEDGISEYNKYHQIICGKVDNAHVRQREYNPSLNITYTVTDMIHVHYAKGANPRAGDSGAPTGNGRTLLGLVTDQAGDSSKAKHMSDIYRGAKWIVPGH